MKPGLRAVIWLAACLSLGSLARGQADIPPAATSPACKPAFDDIHGSSRGSPERKRAIAILLDVDDNAACFGVFAVQSQAAERQTYQSFLKKALAVRLPSQQAGSSAGTGGTTSLVSKGPTAQVLSVAAEYGALTESVSNQIVTLHGGLDGLGAALVRQNLFEYCPLDEAPPAGVRCLHEKELGFLRRISYGVSFNTSQNSQGISGMPSGSPKTAVQPVTFTASGRDISSLTARFTLWTQRDTASAAFQKAWREGLTAPSGGATKSSSGSKGGSVDKGASPSFVMAASTELLGSLRTLLSGLELNKRNTTYNHWFEKTLKDLVEADEAGDDEKVYRKWNEDMKQFVSLAESADPHFIEQVAGLLRALSRYSFEEAQFVSSIADKPVLTLEYSNDRPLGQITTSTIRLIFDKGIGKSWSVTANAGLAIYDSQPSSNIPGAGRLRDVQIGVEADRKFASLAFLGTPTLSGAYYFQHQNSPAILNVNPSMPLTGITFAGLPAGATQVFAKKGNLDIGQLKLTLGSGQSGVRFPVAVSYSNRTELITKPEWRAQIGISYDFDSLFAK